MGVVRPTLIVFVVLAVLTFGYADIGSHKAPHNGARPAIELAKAKIDNRLASLR